MVGQPAARARPGLLATASVIALVLAIPASLAYRRAARLSWARGEAVPEIIRLTEAGDTVAALALATAVERVLPEDTLLEGLWASFSAPVSIVSAPVDAEVFAQPYENAADGWQPLGRTPVSRMRLARAVYRIRIEKEGFEPRLVAAPNPGAVFGNLEGAAPPPLVIIELVPQGTVLSATLPVPATSLAIGLSGFASDHVVDIPPFAIDRLEVTNRLYKGFVDRGGYTNQELWDGLPFTIDGQAVAWDEAVAGFVDTTGRGAPAGWELGDYRPGQVDFPVTGVSWFEAVAYCRSVGRELPTIYHWARAGLSAASTRSGLASAMAAFSNLSGKGLSVVGRFHGLGPYGTYDMAGNAREWVWNQAPGGRRWIVGGGWSDARETFTVPISRSPFDRSPANGFRCADYGPSAGAPEALRGRVDLAAAAAPL